VAMNAGLRSIGANAGGSVLQTTPACYEPLVERDLVPDSILKAGIRRLIKQRLRHEDKGDVEEQQAHLMRYIEQFPAEFFASVLGSHRKYSCCYWREGDRLDAAERRMLDLTAQRAQIVDGHSILDLVHRPESLQKYAGTTYLNRHA